MKMTEGLATSSTAMVRRLRLLDAEAADPRHAHQRVPQRR